MGVGASSGSEKLSTGNMLTYLGSRTGQPTQPEGFDLWFSLAPQFLPLLPEFGFSRRGKRTVCPSWGGAQPGFRSESNVVRERNLSLESKLDPSGLGWHSWTSERLVAAPQLAQSHCRDSDGPLHGTLSLPSPLLPQAGHQIPLVLEGKMVSTDLQQNRFSVRKNEASPPLPHSAFHAPSFVPPTF